MVKKVLRVTDFGAAADGETLDSKAVQSAINACEYGGTVLFPRGNYRLSTVFLKSGVALYFQNGVKIFGAKNIGDYAPHERLSYPLYQDGSHSYFHTSMFVAEDCKDIAISGKAVIDMLSVWDETNALNNNNRGAKCVAFKNCVGVRLDGFTVLNATDIAVYLAGCKSAYVTNLNLRVHIDGISPDNCHGVTIENCKVVSGDDGIVLKSSYTLNRLEVCKDVTVKNCKIKSRCNALKLGTESNGGFKNISVQNVTITDTRISGIAIESVDGGAVDGVKVENVIMKNANAPFFIHLGRRLRGPEGTTVGSISNITIKNVTVGGGYRPYKAMPWNYESYKAGDDLQYPWVYGKSENFCDLSEPLDKDGPWQMTSNVCGLQGYPLKNITFKNVVMRLNGGVKTFCDIVPETGGVYPEVYVYGRILPAKSIYFRHIDGLKIENCSVTTEFADPRPDFAFDDVNFLRKN